jgi:hypothetical protein
MKISAKKFGDSSAFMKGTVFEYAMAIAELATKYAEADGYHSCDFLFYVKDRQLFKLEDFRIRKASKKLLKGLLK